MSPRHYSLKLFECVESEKPTAEQLIDIRRCLERRADVNVRNENGETPLHLAMYYGKVAVVKLLLKRGANVNARDVCITTPLHAAAHYRKLAIVKLLLKMGADVNAFDVHGYTPLHNAVYISDIPVIELLLENGADINAHIRKGRGHSPLYVAAKYGLTSTAELLLKRGADVYVRDRCGSTALHEAASSGMRLIVELLLNKGIEVNDQDQFKNTPLHSAAGSKVISVVELLLSKGADVNAQAINGYTPLHKAAQSGDISVVKLLLKNKAEVNPYTINGNTPLHDALRSGNISVVELLLNKGAKVNVQATYSLPIKSDGTLNMKPKYGRTPLHEAAHSGNMSAVELLLNKGADVNLRDVSGTTPLYEAVHSKATFIIELLLSNGADVNAITENGNTLLHAAVFGFSTAFKAEQLFKEGDDLNAQVKSGAMPIKSIQFGETSILEILINNGAKINVYNEHGNTPLHLAAEFGLTSVVALLLKNGADVTAKARHGWMPLHKASHSGNISVVELLIKNGADIDAQNEAGNTPLHEAVQSRQTSIVELLLNKCADVSTLNTRGETPLHWAAKLGLTSIMEQLFSRGADLSSQTIYRVTPLHIAVCFGRISTVQLLLNKGADVNAQQIDGESPLHVAVRHNNANLANILLRYGADIMLTNITGETPLSYARLFLSNGNGKKMFKLLETAEKKVKDNGWSHEFLSKISRDNFQNNTWDVSNINFQNNDFKFVKTSDTSGLLGQLYETKMVTLALIRVLNHEHVEHDFFLGANIDGIGALDDICLRYRVKGQPRPVLLFIQIKHKKDSKKNKLTDEVLWDGSYDLSLRKYFKSYLMIKERFKDGNKDPMFAGNFEDIDCYFILYTTAKERITKKIERNLSPIINDLITTKQNSKPFQYSYDQTDIDPLINIVYERVETQAKTTEQKSFHISNYNQYCQNQVINFINRFWIYPGQAKEDEVEHQIKYEINKHYNNDGNSKILTFELHTNVIFLKSHDKIQKWWMSKDVAPYLSRSHDFFRLVKLQCLDNVLWAIDDALINLNISVVLELREKIEKTCIENSFVFTLLCRLFNIDNKSTTIDKNLKNIFFNLLLSDKKFTSKSVLLGRDNFFTLSKFYNETITVKDQYKYLKRAGTSEVGGLLFRTKMLNLISLRALNHRQIEKDYLLGTKIQGIGVMTDICLRFQEKGQQRPIVMFLQLIHREDPRKGMLTDEALWDCSGDFTLKKYLKSYLRIRERFQVIDKDPMFKGEFCDIDCYFILYTSAKETLTKKKIKNRKSIVVEELINTGHETKPFQYNDETFVERLTKVTVIDQIEKLGTVLLQSILHEKCAYNILSDKLIARYHTAIGKEVLQMCDVQPVNKDYRLWQFRSKFFDSDIEYLVILKKTFHKILSKWCCEKDITNECLHKVIKSDDWEYLKSLKIKLPIAFGNVDMTFSGNRAKVEKRIKVVADILVQLMKFNKDTKVVTIEDYHVGSGKTIERGIIDINGGIGSAVGNLLLVDRESKMLKFNLENKTLPPNARLFLKELKDDRHKPFIEDLSSYRINVLVNGFPKNSFDIDKYDEILAIDFLHKFWFYADQAKEDEVERILKGEISNKHRNCKIRKDYLDFISVHSHMAIQKWWIQTPGSHYLNRASELFQTAELADIYNLLQTVINYMYISKIDSIDIKVNSVSENDNSERMSEMFHKIVTTLYKLFDPQFELPRYSINTDIFSRPTFYLKIHPELEWVALTVTSVKKGMNTSMNVEHSFIGKACPMFGHRRARDGFRFYELSVIGQIYTFRERLTNTLISEMLLPTPMLR